MFVECNWGTVSISKIYNQSCLPEVLNLFDVTLNHVSNFFSSTFTWKKIKTI